MIMGSFRVGHLLLTIHSGHSFLPSSAITRPSPTIFLQAMPTCFIFLSTIITVNLTEDQILTLAPDEPSKKAGKELANPSKWVTRGASQLAIWGECQGSGSKPYQTQIDRTSIAFKCSCPSRKFPCKHGIALGLLFARQPDLFTPGDTPAWVTEWISKRVEKEEKKTVKKEGPVDEAAGAKRLEAREQKVADGIEELLLWIKDVIRNGIINLPDKPSTFWEGTARRMIDAQAPGLAGMVRNLGNTNFFREGWHSTFLESLLNIYLVAKGYHQKETLDPVVVQDLRNWIGFTVNQDALKEQPGVLDTWLVVAKQVSDENNLTVERNWLYGLNSNQYALVLQFIIRGQGATLLLSPGMHIEAELVFFPSTAPMRALIKRYIATTAKPPRQLLRGWKEVAETEAAICARFPVRSERPFIVQQLLPVPYNNQWWLKDSEGHIMLIKDDFTGLWDLLALSGGHPLDVAVIGKESIYQPVGVWHREHYKPL